MTIRPMEDRDVDALRAMYNQNESTYDFPDWKVAECAEVVVDSEDKPILGIFAVKTVEMVMICEGTRHPLVRFQAIALAHQKMREVLRVKGYKAAFAVVGEHLASYARRMVRTFGWKKDFTAYRIGG